VGKALLSTHNQWKDNLSEMVSTTKSKQCDSSKAHLYPADKWSYLTDRAMTHDCRTSNVPIDTAFKVEFKIYPKHDLSNEQESNERSKTSMDIMRELASFVCVSEKPTHDYDVRQRVKKR